MAIKYLPGGIKRHNFYIRSASKCPPMLALPKCRSLHFKVCPIIKTFWSEVKSSIKNLTGWSLADSPATYRLHDTHLSVKDYKNSPLKHLLNAAKACILVLWKQTTPPTLKHWRIRVSNIKLMEQLTMFIKN